MKANEWLSVMQQAADYPKHLTPLIIKYGEMLSEESKEEDAVEFAEWINEKQYYQWKGIWHISEDNAVDGFTSKELYQEYLKQKK